MPVKGSAGEASMDPAGIPGDEDVRPLVARVVNDRSLWIFGGVLLLVAILLFTALEARRNAVVNPGVVPDGSASDNLISAPPSLSVPDLGLDDGVYAPTVPTLPYASPPQYGPVVLQPAGQSFPGPAPAAPKKPVVLDPDSAEYARSVTGQYNNQPQVPPQYRPPVAAPVPVIENILAGASMAGNRVGASRFLNPATTVPQGAVIQAVLETALDSNRPGFVRAIVSRDVRSFDGNTVLIPRGSRLFGEYKAELARGQNRAFIQWQTLTRPDGVQIAVNSPAADPLGRAGVKGSVNSHFFERFAGALLQSTLDLGVGIATREASGTVIIAPNNNTQNTQIQPNQDAIKPTLKVKHGATVSVFVARDLDFSSVI